MKITGEHRIPADRQTVWRALNDPDVLKDCLPGCESIEKTSDTHMNARITARVGPVKASFSGAVTLSDLDPPNGYTITGEGQGGAAGFASGGAKVHLSEAGPKETILTYEAEAKVGGKLAQIGSRLIDSTAKKLAEDFFEKFVARASELAASAEPAAAVGAAVAASAAPVAATPKPASAPALSAPPSKSAGGFGGIPMTYWVAGLVAIAVILILVFTL